MYCLCKYPNCLTIREVYDFFEIFYPNISIYKSICYSNKTCKCIKVIRRQGISFKRIYKIEYFVISKHFEISYFKRHYRRTGMFILFEDFL